MKTAQAAAVKAAIEAARLSQALRRPAANACSIRATPAATPAPVNKAALQYITERNVKRDRIADIPFHRLWRPGDAGELTFVGLRVVDQQNLLIASNGTENVVLPITPEQRHHLAQHQHGITLTISSAVTIQAHVLLWSCTQLP